MQRLLLASVACLLAPGALGGGIDQSGQPVTLLFRDGNYAEVSLGYWMPTIRAEGSAGNATENAYGDLPDYSGGIKKQFTERFRGGADHRPALRRDRELRPRLPGGRLRLCRHAARGRSRSG